MRLSKTAIVIVVLVGGAVALPALALQDTPTPINGVDTVCTGVGSGKDDPRWGNYPVKLVLATPGGADLAGAHVTLSKGGKTLVETDCDAPWILFSPEPGDYTVTATIDGHGTRTANVSVGKAQKTVTLTFPSQTAQQ
jgi:hypothetical protein